MCTASARLRASLRTPAPLYPCVPPPLPPSISEAGTGSPRAPFAVSRRCARRVVVTSDFPSACTSWALPAIPLRSTVDKNMVQCAACSARWRHSRHRWLCRHSSAVNEANSYRLTVYTLIRFSNTEHEEGDYYMYFRVVWASAFATCIPRQSTYCRSFRPPRSTPPIRIITPLALGPIRPCIA